MFILSGSKAFYVKFELKALNFLVGDRISGTFIFSLGLCTFSLEITGRTLVRYLANNLKARDRVVTCVIDACEFGKSKCPQQAQN